MGAHDCTRLAFADPTSCAVVVEAEACADDIHHGRSGARGQAPAPVTGRIGRGRPQPGTATSTAS